MVARVGWLLGAALTLSQVANASEDSSRAFQERVNSIMKGCADDYTAHRIATHTAAVLCATVPIIEAYREVRFPDMDLVYEFASTAVELAAKLDDSKISESAYQAEFFQASMKLAEDEIHRADDRARAESARMSNQAQRNQAFVDKYFQNRAASEQYKALARSAAQERLQHEMDQERAADTALAAAFMKSMEGLRPHTCSTTFSAAGSSGLATGWARSTCN